MDGQAAQDWKQEKKVAKLIGVKGHLLAARGIIRAERATRKSSAKKRTAAQPPLKKERCAAMCHGPVVMWLGVPKVVSNLWQARNKAAWPHHQGAVSGLHALSIPA